MTNASATIREDALVGLAFPVIRVRYAGPTDHRGSRYIATLRGVRATESYDYAKSGSENAYSAARSCWAKYKAQHAEAYAGDDKPRVFVPGDLDADSYAFTVVPAGFLGAAEPEPAPDEVVTVTRTDYPGAPVRGDRFGWVVAAANGEHMTHPYRDKAHADDVRGEFAPGASLVHVTLNWN